METVNAAPRYQYREVHEIDAVRAFVRVTVRDGAFEVEVDDYSGRGRVPYVEEAPTVDEFSCDHGDADDWREGCYEGIAEALEVLHDLSPGHWGPASICYREPCAPARDELDHRFRELTR